MEKEVKRIKMIVAYDGTNYKGWQVQPNGITIEEVLNRHLNRHGDVRHHVSVRHRFWGRRSQ